MFFDHAWVLWSLLPLTLLVVRSATGVSRRRRARVGLGLTDPGPGDGSARLLAAAVFLVVALAGPRWGMTERPVSPTGRDVVIALDVSRSMGVADAVPDRLGAAVAAARSLVGALGASAGDRVAVVAFAGRGVQRCPLTASLGGAVETLSTLRVDDTRPGGTDLGAAILTALDVFNRQGPSGGAGRTLVVLSDGEDHPGRWKEAATRAHELGVIVHTVAIGDDRVGGTVPPSPGTVDREAGREVVSKRSDVALAAIAQTTGGVFVPLGVASVDLGALYRDRIARTEEITRDAGRRAVRADRAGVFLLVAFTLVVAACRPSRVTLGNSRKRLARVTIGLVVVGLIAAVPRDVHRRVEAGRASYHAGRFEEALTHFEAAQAEAPEEAVPAYDVAVTLHQLGRRDAAEAAYLSARRSPSATGLLRLKVDYGRGNLALARGDVPAAIAYYSACLATSGTLRSSEADRVRDDAAANLRFAESRTPRSPSAAAGPSETRPDPPAETETDRAGRTGETSTRDAPRPVGTDDRGPSPSGRRGQGGAGGSGPAPPRRGSPEAALENAVEKVREARDRRLPSTAPMREVRAPFDW